MSGYAMAGSMALNIWGASQKAKAMAQEEASNIEAEREMNRLNFNRQQQQYAQQMSGLKQQQTVDSFNISLSSSQAEGQLALHKSGTNLAGASINELDAEISREAHADLMASQRQFNQASTNLNQERIQANENRQIQADQRKTADYTQLIKSAFLSSAASGLGKL